MENDYMADVTFGVKVPEEMKNELSELMKESTVSGKEFMGMLIASYKLEKTKESTALFDGDLKELQGIIKRIQSLFINMIDKSSLEIETIKGESEKKLSDKENEKKQFEETIEAHQATIHQLQENIKALEAKNKQLENQLIESNEDIKAYKQQLKNQSLLDTKYQDEINALNEKLESYKRLDLEIQERNDECNKLKQRNDEIASEVWFLKREIEKNQNEKEVLTEKYQKDMSQIKVQHELEIKNQLLEQKLSISLENVKLMEEISTLKDQLAKSLKINHEMIQKEK